MSSHRKPPVPVQEAVARAVAALEPDTYTVEQLALLLQLSAHGVRNMAARGELPGQLRLGRRIRFSRKVVDRWLSEAGTAVA